VCVVSELTQIISAEADDNQQAKELKTQKFGRYSAGFMECV